MSKKLLLLSILCLCFPLLLADIVSAEIIRGFLEFNYSHLNAQEDSPAGPSQNTKTDSFLQRYNLNMDRKLYPNVSLRAGGIFEQASSKNETDGTEVTSMTSKLIPSVNLRMSTPFILASTGYNRQEVTHKSNTASPRTDLRDTYTVALGWRPLDLPSVDTQFVRTHTYDKEHNFRDLINNSLFVSFGYSPTDDLNLRYHGAYTDTNNRRNDLEVRTLNQTGRVTYTKQFFDRVSLVTNYNITLQETKTITPGRGDVASQLFPTTGYAALNDNPLNIPTDNCPNIDNWCPNPALLDGDLSTSSGINIGPVSIGGNNKLRNIGLDFSNATDVNTLFLWVDRSLPDSAVSAFSWGIYVSSDNVTWTLHQTVTGTFGLFDEFRFEINFNTVRTRYIKVVTNTLPGTIPVPPGFDVSNIFVTELQAFFNQSFSDISTKTSRTTHLYDVGVRTRLLDNPSLYYDFYYWYTTTEPSGVSRYILTNGLNMRHTISRVFSTSARVAREDVKENEGTNVTYLYTATLTATPLDTVSNSLVLSGRYEKLIEETNHSNSAYLFNSFQLYKGLSVGVNGGLSSATTGTGEKTNIATLNSGATIAPNDKLTLTLSYADTRSEKTGGAIPDSATSSESLAGSVAFTPFRTIYLFASYSVSKETDKEKSKIREYAVTWSPFRDGALLFNISYNESLRSESDERITSLAPSLRWNITRRASLNAAYLYVTDTSSFEDNKSRIFNTSLRTSF